MSRSHVSLKQFTFVFLYGRSQQDLLGGIKGLALQSAFIVSLKSRSKTYFNQKNYT